MYDSVISIRLRGSPIDTARHLLDLTIFSNCILKLYRKTETVFVSQKIEIQ